MTVMTKTPCKLPDSNYGALSSYHGPKGFHWLIRGWLGGAARPGLLASLEDDLAGLRRMGVDTLVTLTEEWLPPVSAIEEAGMASRYLAIPDMAPPTSVQAVAMCEVIAEDIRAGRVVAFHCRAGRGRTGTMLAAQLIWHGYSSEAAVEYVKRKNNLWIESESQMQFIIDFENVSNQETI